MRSILLLSALVALAFLFALPMVTGAGHQAELLLAADLSPPDLEGLEVIQPDVESVVYAPDQPYTTDAYTMMNVQLRCEQIGSLRDTRLGNHQPEVSGRGHPT